MDAKELRSKSDQELRDELNARLEREGRTEMAQACFDFLPMRARLDLAGVVVAHRAGAGGEQQRAAIARAIAKQPELLLCDEPTGALDSKTGILVLEAINQVNRELGTTTAVITHNTVIGSMADRVMHIADGKVARIDENTERRSAAELAW